MRLVTIQKLKGLMVILTLGVINIVLIYLVLVLQRYVGMFDLVRGLFGI